MSSPAAWRIRTGDQRPRLSSFQAVKAANAAVSLEPTEILRAVSHGIGCRRIMQCHGAHQVGRQSFLVNADGIGNLARPVAKRHAVQQSLPCSLAISHSLLNSHDGPALFVDVRVTSSRPGRLAQLRGLLRRAGRFCWLWSAKKLGTKAPGRRARAFRAALAASIPAVFCPVERYQAVVGPVAVFRRPVCGKGQQRRFRIIKPAGAGV